MEPIEPSNNDYQIQEYLDDQWYRSETTNNKHFVAECQAEWIEKVAWFLIIQAHQALTSVSQSPQTRQRDEHTKNAILSAKCQSKAAKLVVYSFIHSLFFCWRAAASKHFYQTRPKNTQKGVKWKIDWRSAHK